MNHKILYEKLGKNIKKIRNEKGLTQEQLSEKVGVGLEFIGKIEIAKKKPSIDTFFKIAIALEVEPYELLKFD